jgi:hypothetical protein
MYTFRRPVPVRLRKRHAQPSAASRSSVMEAPLNKEVSLADRQATYIVNGGRSRDRGRGRGRDRSNGRDKS